MEKTFTEKFKDFTLRKRILIPLGLVVVIWGGYKLAHMNDAAKNTTTDFVKIIDLKQTVLATGQVTSNTDLKLSFNGSGIVTRVSVKVGDTVKKGQVLATLDQGTVGAALTSARGAVAAAKAKYDKILSGASNEEIIISTIALDNANRDLQNTKLTQDTLVQNAYNNLLNSYPEAVPTSNTVNYTPLLITGNYTGGKEGEIKLSVYQTGNGMYFSASGLVSGSGMLNTSSPQMIGNSGLYVALPSSGSVSVSDWTISIPNKKASNYLTNYNAYQNALKTQAAALATAQSIVDQRTAELALKKSQARPADIDLAKADILQAQGQFEQASAVYENTILRAPADGTITSLDIKIGELAVVQKEVMILQDVKNMYLEANINEANIANVKIGAPVTVSFDAFGVDKVFTGAITEVDPASTVVSGVVNYKIKSTIEQVPGLRPGMTANMTILIAEKPSATVVPSRALITKDTGKIIRIVTNTKKKTYKEVPVTTGLEGDGGLVDITSGVSNGEEFVLLIKQ